MKRMIAVLTALIMVFTSAVALADNSSGVKLVAVAGNIESNQVTVDIMLTENTGIAGIKLAVKYDTSKMKALNVKRGSEFPSATSWEGTPGEIGYNSYDANNNHTITGTLMSVTFELIAGEWERTEVTIECRENDVTDEFFNLIPIKSIVNATITKPHTHKAGTEWKKDESSHWHECTGEGCSEKMDVTPHSWDNGIVITEATESSKGLMRHTCKVCNATKEEEIPMLQHTHKAGTEWKKDKSSHWHECVGEDCSEKMDVAPHSWNEGVIAQRPSCKNTGIKLFTCTVSGCGATKTEIVAATGHTFDNGTVTTEPTCTIDGIKTFKCTNEGCTETKTEPINALGHKWDEGTVITEPTCTVAGLKSFKCTNKNCDETKTEPVNALGHKWDNGTVTIEPTTTKNGEKTYKCTNAGCTEVKTESIPATGRDYPTHLIPTTPVPPTADMPQTGNTDITMAAIVLILLGGITWIIVSKKKHNN